MAQEIYKYFGNDKIGKIGCDTLLTTIDMDGIMMIMLQGLEQKSSDQLVANEKLSEELLSIKNENILLKKKIAKLEVMQDQILALQKAMDKIKTDKEMLTSAKKEIIKEAKYISE